MRSKRKVEGYRGQIKMRFKIKSNCTPRPSPCFGGEIQFQDFHRLWGMTEMYDVNAFAENLIDEGMLAENFF